MTGGWGSADGSAPAAWQRTAQEFAAAVESGRLDLPLPGSGATWQRWAAFTDLAEEDLSLARLSEGHADAVAILAELEGPTPRPGSRWGVWAANPPGPNVTASRRNGSWVLRGTKQYCSGARVCTHALVTARAGDEEWLFAVAVDDLEPHADSWPATGMAGSDTLDVGFPAVPAEPVGPPGGYTGRPGFSHGGAGVAACWYGGARGVARALARAAAKRDVGPHALAHLGAIDIALRTTRVALGRAADEIDADPGDLRGEGALRALRVRALAEATASDVMGRTGRALGAGPLSHDEAHSRAVADLTVYLRQHHAEQDLARLGKLVAEQGATW
jgi:alkylation response protein AidB-like acyl-CoA dehydrogenase